MAARTWMASLPQTQSGFVNLDGYRMQRCEQVLASVSHPFEGSAGIHNPSGGGVHEFQLFDPGSADRGERRLSGAF